jgi:hypothetical protein
MKVANANIHRLILWKSEVHVYGVLNDIIINIIKILEVK